MYASMHVDRQRYIIRKANIQDWAQPSTTNTLSVYCLICCFCSRVKLGTGTSPIFILANPVANPPSPARAPAAYIPSMSAGQFWKILGSCEYHGEAKWRSFERPSRRGGSD